MSKKDVVKTLYIYIFIFCPVFLYADSLRHQVFGDFNVSYFTGKEEYYTNTGLGTQKLVSDLSFRNTELNLEVDLDKKYKKLYLSLNDRVYGDLLSKRNTKTRFSSYNNLLEFKANYLASKDIRFYGRLSSDIYKDQSFDEFSHENLKADFGFEKRIRLNTFVGIGGESSQVRFDHSRIDDFDQQDIYFSYFRFSKAKYTLTMNENRDRDHVKFVLMDAIKESTRNSFRDWGYLKSLSSFHKMDAKPNLFIYKPYKLQSDMSFDLEYRIRNRELYNSQEKSFIEQQINGAVMFYLNDKHTFRIVDTYSDREYAKDSIADRLFSHRRNKLELTHNVQWNKIYASSGLLLDYTFHKDKEDFDQHDISIDFDLSWDIMPGWNFSYNYSNLRKSYDKPQELFTDYRQIHGNFTIRADLSYRTSVVGSFFNETKRYNQFINQIDSPYDRIGQDYRFVVNSKDFWSWHLGYKWEEEEHSSFKINDRYERLAYIGTRFSL